MDEITPNRPDFRTVVSEWLNRRDWGQADLARAADVSPSLVSKWLMPDKSRRVTPDADNLKRVAKVIGVPHIELMRLCEYLDDEEANLPEEDPIVADVLAWSRLFIAGMRDAPPDFWLRIGKPFLQGTLKTGIDLAIADQQRAATNGRAVR
jgi:transcriptional regulator with XRE-family HTH domain